MSTPERSPATTPSSGPWPVFTSHECRVLGVLVEKAKTTPDAYPLSLNALVTGSNQKSNRDPVMELDEADVENALLSLQKRSDPPGIAAPGGGHAGYVQKIVGGRVERWRHVLYEAWHVNKVELAVLAELLLRGAQTEGELRGRASRMEPIDDVEALRPVLRGLADRKLVVFLGQEGRRGTMVTHGFYASAELERLRASAASGTLTSSEPAPSAPSRAESDLEVATLRAELNSLRQQLAQVQAQVVELTEQVRKLAPQ
jgi:uncharacterized protein YceH (UPF0502 family)